MKPNSPVRIAGVERRQGRRSSRSPGGQRRGQRDDGDQEVGLPIHEDAQLKIRPRVFLEGNFFVDIKPGSPSRRS